MPDMMYEFNVLLRSCCCYGFDLPYTMLGFGDKTTVNMFFLQKVYNLIELGMKRNWNNGVILVL